MSAQHLWQAMANGDGAARERLVIDNLGLIHHTARQLRAALPANCDQDDLLSAGTLGLLAAIDSFDASRGLAFSTFAVPRIRGAMLDELRRLDVVPRTVRRRQRDLAHARQQLANTLGHEPSARQVATELGVDMLTLARWESDALNGTRVSLERSTSSAPEQGEANIESMIGMPGPTVEDHLTREQELDAMKVALRKLSDQERLVISFYFTEELKLHEIAAVMRLTESRISQIRTKALGRLRAEMASLRGASPRKHR